MDRDLRDDEAGRETVAAVIRACRLLECFSTARPVVTLAELTAHSGLNKPTVHRLMSSFVTAGWVSRDHAGAYRIRMPLFVIAAAALDDFDIRTHARAELQELAVRFGDTAYLMVPSDAGAVVIDRVEGSGSLVVAGLSVGTVLPYHAAAGPLLMLAYDEQLRRRVLDQDLPAFTDATHTDAEALEARLSEVAREGFVISRDDYLDGVSAVAAAIRDGEVPGARLVGTISLGGPSEDFDGTEGELRRLAVCEAAARLTATLANVPR